MAHRAYIGIGSNLNSPRENCAKAIELIGTRADCTLAACSSFYKTEPIGMIDQGWFINAAIAIDTDLKPLELLNVLLSIEMKMGRIRTEKWGPRLIDLDILFYSDDVLSLPQLKIPHPEITRRRFVLAPLAEIAGDYTHPTENKPISVLLKDLDDDNEVMILNSSG